MRATVDILGPVKIQLLEEKAVMFIISILTKGKWDIFRSVLKDNIRRIVFKIQNNVLSKHNYSFYLYILPIHMYLLSYIIKG